MRARFVALLSFACIVHGRRVRLGGQEGSEDVVEQPLEQETFRQDSRHPMAGIAAMLMAQDQAAAFSTLPSLGRIRPSSPRAVSTRMDGEVSPAESAEAESVEAAPATTAPAESAPLLEVDDLSAIVPASAQKTEKKILKGISLKVNRGEVHAIMGPNGCGKSTLSKVIAGHPAYEVTGGCVSLDGEDILELEADERAQKGVFLAFQYPVEIPGVSNDDFLRLAVNSKRKADGKEEYDPLEFFGVLAEKLDDVGMSPDFIGRDVNAGFSGGEKKKNEILQMALLEPELAILDETDSGLDIDALKTVAEGVNAYRSEKNAIVMITHYQRLLDYIKPDFVHIMANGKIQISGGPELALQLEKGGYASLGIEAPDDAEGYNPETAAPVNKAQALKPPPLKIAAQNPPFG